MSNGQTESPQGDYVEMSMAKIVDKIEKQSELFGLQRVNVDKSCSSYLTMSEDELARLSPEELCLAEIKLSSYAFCIQKHINVANSLKNWAGRCISLLVAKEHFNFDKFMSSETRRYYLCNSDEYAKRLETIMFDQQLIVDEFSYLSQSVQHVSDAFGKLARIKRKEQ